MTTTSTGAAPKGAASGTSRAKKKTVTVRGVKLNLPSKVPLRILKQMVAVSETDKTGDLIEALELILPPEEMDKLWDIDVDANNGTLDALQDLFAEAIDKVFKATGITPPESPASP